MTSLDVDITPIHQYVSCLKLNLVSFLTTKILEQKLNLVYELRFLLGWAKEQTYYQPYTFLHAQDGY